MTIKLVILVLNQKRTGSDFDGASARDQRTRERASEVSRSIGYGQCEAVGWSVSGAVYDHVNGYLARTVRRRDGCGVGRRDRYAVAVLQRGRGRDRVGGLRRLPGVPGEG